MDIPVKVYTNEELRQENALLDKQMEELQKFKSAILFHYDAMTALVAEGLKRSEEFIIHDECLASLLINALELEEELNNARFIYGE